MQPFARGLLRCLATKSATSRPRRRERKSRRTCGTSSWRNSRSRAGRRSFATHAIRAGRSYSTVATRKALSTWMDDHFVSRLARADGRSERSVRPPRRHGDAPHSLYGRMMTSDPASSRQRSGSSALHKRIRFLGRSDENARSVAFALHARAYAAAANSPRLHSAVDSRPAAYPPTLRENQWRAHAGIRSTNGVNDHLRALERKRVLDARGRMKSRALRPTNLDSQELRRERLRSPNRRTMSI